MDSDNKKGYLYNDYRFFHLKDQKNMEFEPHYHDFYKIIIFISGKVTYLIEGKAYELQPCDILFINKNDIHTVIIDDSEVYERIVLWMRKDFLDKQSTSAWNLGKCFDITAEKKLNLMRLKPSAFRTLQEALYRLEAAFISKEFGSDILMNALFTECIIYLNRYCLSKSNMDVKEAVSCDEQINSLLNFINENLAEELTLDSLAARFFMSKYTLMHKFKKQTGYSLYSYILKKRLIKANHLLKAMKSVSETCVLCGFADYSNFIRAYKKMFGISPKKHSSMQLPLHNEP